MKLKFGIVCLASLLIFTSCSSYTNKVDGIRVKIPDYSKMDFSYDKSKIQDVTDDEFYEYMNYILENEYYTEEKITEGTIKENDLINISYLQKMETTGEVVENVESYNIKVGDNIFLDGFDEAVIGKEIGKTVNYTTKFPDNFWSSKKAGKAVKMKVTINYKIRRTPGVLNDAFVKENTESKTVEELKEHYKKNTKNRRIYIQLAEKGQENLVDLINKSEFDEKTIKEQAIKDAETTIGYYKEIAGAINVTYDEYLKYLQFEGTAEDFKSQLIEANILKIKQQTLLLSIAKKEQIELDNEHFALVLYEYLKNEGIDESQYPSIMSNLERNDPALYKHLQDMALVVKTGEQIFYIEYPYFLDDIVLAPNV